MRFNTSPEMSLLSMKDNDNVRKSLSMIEPGLSSQSTRIV